MDTNKNFDANDDENLKNNNKKPPQPKLSPEKTSPSQKKNNNNIQMSYYFPSNTSHENTEKEAEFPTNINALQDSFGKMNLKINNEVNPNPSNFNLYDNSTNEAPDNYNMIYNQNQNYKNMNQMPNQMQNFNKSNQNFPNNNANFYNKNLPQNQNNNKYQNMQNPNFMEESINLNNIQVNQNQSSYQNQFNNIPNNATTEPYDEEEYPENIIQKEKNRNAKKIFESSLTYQPQNKNYSQIARFFVIKSVDEDNIHKSIKFRIWCSTFKGNQKLQKAFKEAENSYPIYLFFSVNGSGRFLGLAQMTSEVDYHANFNYWSQGDKWKGFFFVVWLIIKDVPNKAFRHIINEYNEGKPITSSRDTQEIHPAAGMEALKIFKEYQYESSILDDFQFYEKKQNNFPGTGQQTQQTTQQQPMQNQQNQQQQFYNNNQNNSSNINNNMPTNMKNLNNQNLNFQQNNNQFNQHLNTNNNPNEDFYQKMNSKEYGNNNNNNSNNNFSNQNQNYIKKDQNEKNLQTSNYIINSNK